MTDTTEQRGTTEQRDTTEPHGTIEQPGTEPAEAPAAPPEQARRSGFPWTVLVALALLAVGALATVALWPEWSGRLPGLADSQDQRPAQSSSDEIEVLRADLAATRERVRQLELRMADAAPRAMADAAPREMTGSLTPEVDLGPVTQRLASVEAAVAEVKNQPQVPARLAEQMSTLEAQLAELRKTAADSASVLRLADRVEQAEAGMRDLQGRRSSAATLLLAVGLLRDAVNNGMAYDAELRAVKVLAEDDADTQQALDLLKPAAAAGIPTRPVLAARFAALAPTLVRAEFLPEQQGWWRQTLARLSTLVSIRREDGAAAGDSAAAVIARAEAGIGRGDLAAALAELEALSQGPATEAAPWLADARARLAADRVLADLSAGVVAATGPRH